MAIRVCEVIEYLKTENIPYRYFGKDNLTIYHYCPLNRLKADAITWVRNVKDANISDLASYKNLLLLAEYDAGRLDAQISVLYVNNVHRTFFKILEHFFSDENQEHVEPKIEKTAIVETTNIGENFYAGHHTYIGENVTIGDNVTIFHNVTIQGTVTIGDGTVIESGVVVGACGYGHYLDVDHTNVCVPHLGGVTIGKYVRLGANTCISRGCLSDTIIEDYVKIDNLCHIAHNDVIRRGAMITAGTAISGSTTVEENVWLAPGTLLNNSITVGKNSFLGIGTVATKDVPENMVAVGVPARMLHKRY